MEQQNTRMQIEDIPFDQLEKAGVDKGFIDRMETRERIDFLNGFR